jgi:hypothetical protein
MNVSCAPSTDMSIRAKNGVVNRGPQVVGLYSWFGLYRCYGYTRETGGIRHFLTKRGMIRWFKGNKK